MEGQNEIREILDADDPIALAIELEWHSLLVDQAWSDSYFVQGAVEASHAEFAGRFRVVDPMRSLRERL